MCSCPPCAPFHWGLVGRQRFDRRQGRNQAFNSAGNVFAAVTMGGIGYFLSNRSIFYFVAALAVPTLLSLNMIRSQEIDYGRARGAAGGGGGASGAGANDMKRGHALSLFLVCSVMYHFANAAMLSLLGEMLSKGQGQRAMVYMSACVVTTQLIIMASASFFSGAAGRWGRRPTLMIAFSILPIRGLSYLVTSNPLALISIQVLDGVASSIFGVVSVLVIADIAKGSGRFNLMLGAFTTAIGVGAALSQLVAGSIAHRFGYHAGFGFLTGTALVALLLLVTLMPETLQQGRAEAAHSRREPAQGDEQNLTAGAK